MPTKNAQSVSLIITVASVDEVQNFYKDKLGFTRVMGMVGEDGQLNRATVVLDGARLMFVRSQGKMDGQKLSAEKRLVDIYLEVADVEAYHAQLEKRGVTIADPLTLQWWGDKTFKVTDPVGYEVWFYQTVAAPKPPKGVTIV